MGQVGIESTYHWLHVGSVLCAASSCLIIALVLLYIVSQIRNLPFRFAYVGFAIFMLTLSLDQFVTIGDATELFSELDLAVSGLMALSGAVAALVLVGTVPKILALAKGAVQAHEHSLQLEETCEELGEIVEKGGEEIRMRLNAIVAPTRDLLLSGACSEADRKQLELIQSNTALLLKTLDGYLDQAP